MPTNPTIDSIDPNPPEQGGKAVIHTSDIPQGTKLTVEFDPGGSVEVKVKANGTAEIDIPGNAETGVVSGGGAAVPLSFFVEEQ